MPIQAEPDGTLDVENATLRSRNIVSLTSLVAGNDVVRSTAAPTLEVYGDPSNDGGVLPTLELVSNVGAAGSAFTRLTSNAGVFTIQSGTNGTTNSKGDIAFSSIGGDTEHMRIQGSTGNVGIGTVSPGKKLEIADGYQSLGGYIDTYNVLGIDGGVVLGVRQGGGTYVDGMRISASGYVGIGTTSARTKFNVNNTVAVRGNANTAHGGSTLTYTFPANGMYILTFCYIGFYDANIARTYMFNKTSFSGPYYYTLSGSSSYIQISTAQSSVSFVAVNLPGNYNDFGIYVHFLGGDSY
jgi:hypothetical protein